MKLKATVSLKFWPWLDQLHMDLKSTYRNFFMSQFCSIHCESDLGFEVLYDSFFFFEVLYDSYILSFAIAD